MQQEQVRAKANTDTRQIRKGQKRGLFYKAQVQDLKGTPFSFPESSMLLSKLGQLVELVGSVFLCPDDLFQVERDLELNLFPRCVASMNHLLSPAFKGVVVSMRHAWERQGDSTGLTRN